MRKAISNNGFTLLEALTSITILSILMVVATPLFNGYVISTERAALNQLFIDAIIESRFRARAQYKTLTICPLDQSKECHANWSMGNIAVFNDINGDKQWQSGELLFKRFSFESPNHKIKFNRGSGKYLKAKSNGYFNFFGSFIFCELDRERGNKLIIATSGRMRIDNVDNDDCEF